MPKKLSETDHTRRYRRWRRGYTDAELAEAEGLTKQGVRHWRHKFGYPPNTINRVKRENGIFEEFLYSIGVYQMPKRIIEMAELYVRTDKDYNLIAKEQYLSEETVRMNMHRVRQYTLWSDRVEAKQEYIEFLEKKYKVKEATP